MVENLFEGVTTVEENQARPVVTGVCKVQVTESAMFVSPKNNKTFGLKLSMRILDGAFKDVEVEEVIWKKIDGMEREYSSNNGGKFKPFDSTLSDLARQLDMKAEDIKDPAFFTGKELTLIFESYVSDGYTNSRVQWADKQQNKKSGFAKPTEGLEQDNYIDGKTKAQSEAVSTAPLDDEIPF